MYVELPRSIIRRIFRYLVWNRKQPTLFTAESIQDRVPLQNMFDPSRPWVTNIYVQRMRRCDYLRACGILGTNKDLRREMKAVMKELGYRPPSLAVPDAGRRMRSAKNQKCPSRTHSYEMDLVVVPGIGFFPTWIRPPPRERPKTGEKARSERKKLIVHLRAVPLPEHLFPGSWVKAAQHDNNKDDPDGWHRARWSLCTVLSLYGGNLSLVPATPDGRRMRGYSLNCSSFHAETRTGAKPHDANMLVLHLDTRAFTPEGERPPSSSIGACETPEFCQVLEAKDKTAFGRGIFQTPLEREHGIRSMSVSEVNGRLHDDIGLIYKVMRPHWTKTKRGENYVLRLKRCCKILIVEHDKPPPVFKASPDKRASLYAGLSFANGPRYSRNEISQWPYERDSGRPV